MKKTKIKKIKLILKKLLTWEFYEDVIVATLKFFIRRNPISPFYAFWKTLFVAKEWKSFKKYFRKFDKHFSSHHPFVSAISSFALILAIFGGIFYLSVLKNPQQVQAEWWDDLWSYRKVLEIDHDKVEGDLSNFPVLVSLTDAGLATNAQVDGDDIVFTTSVGKNKLAHEIESYTSATGTLVAWVKVPNIFADRNVKIDMYYGNSTVSSQQDVENVWADNYKIVQHMNEDPSGIAPQMIDSTMNNNDGTSVGTMLTGDLVDVKIGEGLDFDGVDDYIEFADSNVIDVGESDATFQFWIDLPDADINKQILVKPHPSSPFTQYLVHAGSIASSGASVASKKLTFVINENWGQQGEIYRTVDDIIDGNMHKIDAVRIANGSSLIYVDGVSVSLSVVNSWGTKPYDVTNAASLKVGQAGGTMDEYKMSLTALSEDWILTEYNNQSDPSTFFAVSTQQTSPGNPVGYWSFDEGNGTIAHDESNFGNDGTITGANWADESECVVGKCLRFDGTNDYVNVGTDESLRFDEQDFSLALWVKPILLHTDEYYGLRNTVLSRGPAGTYNYYVQIDDKNTVKFIERGSAEGLMVYSFTTPDLMNTWNHLEFTYKDGNINFYLNGALSDSQAVTGTIEGQNADVSYLGSQNAGQACMYFDGFVDEVKIHPYARSADQVKQDYNAGASGARSANGTAVSFGGTSDKWMTDGLVGHWKMDEVSWNGTAGEVLDSSGNDNDGVRVGDATTEDGKYGNGGIFDGTGDYVTVPDNEVFDFSTNLLTISSWVKFSSSSIDSYRAIISQDLDSFEFNKDSANRLRLEMRYSDETVLRGHESVASLIAADRWYFVLATFNPLDGTMEFYVDGVKGNTTYVDTKIGGTLKNSTKNIFIGGRNTGTLFMDGFLDEARVYNRKFSSDEVKKLYEYAPGPVLHLKMDEKNGTTAYDTSGNGNSGVLTSMDSATDWVRGKYGSALDFDGTNDYVEIPHSDSLTNQVFGTSENFTMEAWVYPRAWVSYSNIIGKTTAGSWSNTTNGIWVASGGIYCIMGSNVSGNPTGSYIQATYKPSLNAWYHVSCNADGTDLVMHLDGVEVRRVAISGLTYARTTNTSPVILGRRALSSVEAFDGLIDDVRLYSYPRTQKQILEDMNAERPASKSPVLHFDFNEGRGPTAYDKSIHGNNGTLTPNAAGTNLTVASMWKKGGKIDGMAELDGTDDRITIPNSTSLENMDAFSISFWANLNGNYYSTAFFTKGDFYSGGHGWQLYTDGSTNSGVLVFARHYSTSGLSIATEGGVLERNAWNLYTITTDGTDSADGVHIYKNGVEVAYGGKADATGTRDSDASYNFVIGDTSTGGLWNYNGLMDDVKVWNYALTKDEVEQEYGGGQTMSIGGRGTEANNGDATVTGVLANYCVPGDTTQCDAPVLELNFDEKTGTTAFDTSGNGTDGTLTGMDSATDWVRGKYGSALDFDGNNDFIELGSISTTNPASLAGSEGTVSVWVYKRSGGDSFQRIFDKSNGSSSDNGYGLWVDTRKIGVSIDGSSWDSDDVNVISYDTWHYVVAVIKSSGVTMYVDGNQKSGSFYSGAAELPPSVTTNARIGTWNHDTEREWSGMIDDIKIYNYARTPAQIAWDYNKGAPIAHWRMDEGTGTTVHDESGNGNDGTMISMDASTDWVDGKVGKALDFDGNDDYINKGDIIFNDVDQYSACFWFKEETVHNGQIVNKGDDCGVWFNIGLLQKIQYRNGECDGDWSSSSISSNYFVNVGEWTHVCGTFVKDSVDGQRLYFNGKEDANSPVNSTGISGSINGLGADLRIGGMYSFFDGQVDEIQIFNYVLTPEQVKNVYNGGAMRFE